MTRTIKFLIYGQTSVLPTHDFAVAPTFFCEGHCPTLAPTSFTTKTTAKVSPIPKTSSQTTITPFQQPCNNSIQVSDNARKSEENFIKKFFEIILNFFKKLFEILFGAGRTTPSSSQPGQVAQVPKDIPNQPIDSPVPCPSAAEMLPPTTAPEPTSAPIPTEPVVSQPVVSPIISILPSTLIPSPSGGVASTCDPGPNDPEPPADYKRVSYGGKTVNVRTKVMIATAEKYAKSLGVSKPIAIMQGSYTNGVSASAGTHSGGGALDVSISGLSSAQQNNYLKAFRMAGFAAWIRTPAEGFPYHIHAEAIGDKELASLARTQVQNYFDQKNGLSGGRKDTAPASVGRPVPAWATPKYGVCKLYGK